MYLKVLKAFKPLTTMPMVSWISSNHSALLWSGYPDLQCFFSKKMFRGTLSLTHENHNFIVQIGKNKSSQWTKFVVCLAGILTF
jgi:hypothetical protein